MRTTLVALALAAALVAGARCKRSNGAYCDDARPCPGGFACDLTARECHAMIVGGGGDMATAIDMAGCSCAGTTPICVAMSCVSCLSTSDPDASCAAANPSTPFCETSGSDAGSCIACRSASDCSGTAPFCDATTHACRGCIADTECPSLVCDLTPGSSGHGQCVPITMVEYADGSAPSGGMGLTPTTARQKIQDAVNHATGGDKRPYVHIAAGTYNESVTVNNGVSIYLVGADGAIIHPMTSDALGASNGATMTVRNIVATASSGNGGNCQSGSFNAYHSQFIGSSQSGFYALNCGLLLDGNWFDNNSGGGIYIGGGDFDIINNIITRNGSNGGLYQLANSANTTFVNNTVADNIASGNIAGVTCPFSNPTLIVRNTILWNNKGSAGTALGESSCAGEFDASDDVTAGPQSTVDLTNKAPGFQGGTPISPASYHLTADSPCLNEASPLFAPNHDYDFQPRPKPTTMMPDIGADELE